jgi:hypothetical protein
MRGAHVAEALLPLLADAVRRSERLFAAGRLHDARSRLELVMLRQQLAVLRRLAAAAQPTGTRLEASMVQTLWRAAAAARREAGLERRRAAWAQARSRQLGRRSRVLRMGRL